MGIETALYTLLHGRAELEALVDVRIYPMYLPQSPTFPACAYNRTSSRIISLLKNDTNLIEARYEVAAFSKTYNECIEVADQIRQALQRQRGTISGVVIDDITIDDISQDYEQEFEIFESTTDITISYRT